MSTHETCLAFIFWLSHCHGVSPSATIAAAALPNSRLQSSRARLHRSVRNECHLIHPFIQSYLQIVVHDVKIGELGEGVVRRQRPLYHKYDLPRVGLETISDLKADSAHNYIHQVLNLQREYEERPSTLSLT